MDQIVAAGIEVDRLCNILLPAIVNCVANLRDTDSPPIFKLKQALISLAESIQIHLSATEVRVQKFKYIETSLSLFLLHIHIRFYPSHQLTQAS